MTLEGNILLPLFVAYGAEILLIAALEVSPVRWKPAAAGAGRLSLCSHCLFDIYRHRFFRPVLPCGSRNHASKMGFGLVIPAGQLAPLAAAICGFVGTLLVFFSSYGFEPYQGAVWGSEAINRENERIRRRNRWRGIRQQVGLGFLCASFAIQIGAMFLPSCSGPAMQQRWLLYFVPACAK